MNLRSFERKFDWIFGASDPCCPDLLRLTRTAHGWYATEAKWDLRENQEHTISNMLYRLQRRENPLVEDTRLELVEACLQSRCSSRCANPPNKMFLQLTVKNQEHQKTNIKMRCLLLWERNRRNNHSDRYILLFACSYASFKGNIQLSKNIYIIQ